MPLKILLAHFFTTPIFALQINFGYQAGLWCKGSTTDFDSVCLGSNPSNPTKTLSVLTGFFVRVWVILNSTFLVILRNEAFQRKEHCNEMLRSSA